MVSGRKCSRGCDPIIKSKIPILLAPPHSPRLKGDGKWQEVQSRLRP